MKVYQTHLPSKGRLLIVLTLFTFSVIKLQAQTIQISLAQQRPLNSDLFGYDMSTTVRGGVSCQSPELKAILPSLKAKTLRYPAGGFANWYDWHTGWYVDSPYLPPSDANLTKIPNKLEDFKGLLDVTGAKHIFDLNMLTSTLRDQVNMLKHADSIGIPITYIELGNEYYLEAGEEDTTLVLLKYPTPASYGDTAQRWIDTLRKNFPNAKIAMQGAFEKNGQTRTVTWNDSVKAHASGEDAMTFHFYYPSRNGTYYETDAQKMDVNMGDVPDFLYQPYKAWNVLSTNSLPDVRPGKEIWITEFNMSDKERPVHGTWASGLFSASQCLLLLQSQRITHIDIHGVDGYAVFGAYFFNSVGFKFGLSEEAEYTGPVIAPPTDPWGLTAYGNTMTMVGNALDTKTFGSPIDFTGNPQVLAIESDDTIITSSDSLYYNGLLGYHFTNSSGSQAIILNLTGTTQYINTHALFPAGGTFEMRYCSPIKLVAVAGDVTVINGNLPATFTLQPYSIARITSTSVPVPPPTANITPSGATTFCAGDSVVLDAGPGYFKYTWSTGANTRKITAKSTGDYWVHAYIAEAGYYGGDTVHVTVNPVPNKPNIVPLGTKNFCSGGSVDLTLGSLYNCPTCTYYWPLTGASGVTTTVTASSNQYMIATDANGCKTNSDTEVVIVYPLPVVVASSVGPSSACYDVDVTLQATPGYQTYAWSNGSFGQTHTFTVSGNYSVNVTDANNCHGISNTVAVTVWEPPVPPITAQGPTTYCVETPTTLSTIAGYQYQWIKGTVNITGATNQTYAPTLSSTYKVQITDSHGCSNKSDIFGVIVNVLIAPGIGVTGGTSICQGATTILSEPPGYSAYLWSNGQTSQSISVGLAGNYTVTLTDNNGCKATSLPKAITVNALPQPSVTINGPSAVCAGQSVSLSGPGGYSSYTWSNGKTGQNVTADNTAQVTVTVKDANNCYGTSSAVGVTVWDVATPTVSTSSGGITFCKNAGVYLTTQAVSSYQWQKNSINIAGETNQQYYPDAGGSYKVVATDVHGCVKTSTGYSVTVNNPPAPTVSGSSSVCQGQSTTLSTGTTYPAYTWSTGSHNSTIPVSTAGNYSVTVTDGNGCQGTSAPKTVTVNALPTPVITANGPASFCEGGSVTLDAGAGYTNYSWSNGKATQSISPTTGGPFSVTVTNAGGCTGTAGPVTVTVWTVPTPTISTSSGATTFCKNAGVYLTTQSGYNYQWQKNSINIAGQTSQQYYPDAGGSYKVVASDVHGCSKTSTGFSVIVNNPPAPTITGSTTVCQGQSTTLSTGTTYPAYTWSTGSHAATIPVTLAGSYSVTVTDNNGCQGTSAVKTVTVSPLPTPVITANGPVSFCDGGSVTLDAGAGYTTYSWSSGKSTQSISPVDGGVYTVTVTNSGGCKGTAAAVTVTEWVVPNPVVSAVGPTTFCLSAGTYLTTLAGYNTYQWLKGTANVSGATGQTYAPVAGATYKVKVTDTHGCSKTSSTGVAVTVNPLPTASVTVTTSTNLCNGATVKLTEATQTGNTYQWRKDGNNISGATASTYTASTAGGYSCKVTKLTGCTATSNTITVTSNCRDQEIQNTAAEATLKVYPNPSSGYLHIELDLPGTEAGEATVVLRNVVGEVVWAGKAGITDHRMETGITVDGSVSSGVYFVIVTAAEKLYRQQVVLSH